MIDNRKIVIHRLGKSFRQCTRIERETLEPPAAGEVLIRHTLAGVNGVYDQMMCANRVQHVPVTPPADAGVEAAGRIIAVGAGVTTLEVGDPVVTVGAGGGYREFKLCSADQIIPVPADSADVLALIPSGVSAYLALHVTGELRPDDVVCITAAVGGLGNIAVQLAVQAGHHVVAVCGSADKARWLGEIGAARVVNYRQESLADVLEREYPERIDLALDSVGGETFDALLANLAPLGRLVVAGATCDRLPPETVRQERAYNRLYWKGASIRGFMNWRLAEHHAAARAALLDMLAVGSLKPLIDQTAFEGLESVADAVDHLLGGNNVGKVMVRLADGAG